MPPEKTLERRVNDILADVAKLGRPLREDDNLVDHLCVDSLDLVDICARIEYEFGFEPAPDDVEKWKTVGDVIRYVQSKQPVTFSQADVDTIVARAKELGTGPGLCFKLGHLKLSNYAEPHGPAELAMLLVGGWDEKWDLIHATHALIEFLLQRGRIK